MKEREKEREGGDEKRQHSFEESEIVELSYKSRSRGREEVLAVLPYAEPVKGLENTKSKWKVTEGNPKTRAQRPTSKYAIVSAAFRENKPPCTSRNAAGCGRDRFSP